MPLTEATLFCLQCPRAAHALRSDQMPGQAFEMACFGLVGLSVVIMGFVLVLINTQALQDKLENKIKQGYPERCHNYLFLITFGCIICWGSSSIQNKFKINRSSSFKKKEILGRLPLKKNKKLR